MNDPIEQAIIKLLGNVYGVPDFINVWVYRLEDTNVSDPHSILSETPSIEMKVPYHQGDSIRDVLDKIVQMNVYPLLIVLRQNSYFDNIFFILESDNYYTQIYN